MRVILISRSTTTALAAAACAALALLGAACHRPAAVGAAPGRVAVVASFYPLAYVAGRLGGAEVHVHDLTPPGAEPHDLELKASQLAAIEDARVVLVLGHGFQPAVERAAGRRRGTIAVLDRVTARSGTVPRPARRAHVDPHVWLDPVLMGNVVDVVRDALVAADPGHSDVFRARARRLQDELRALDGDYSDGLARCTRHEIVTAHEAFGRLAARYGLTQIGVAGLNPEGEPDPDRLARVADLVRRRGVTTIFSEALVSPKVAASLARDAHVHTAVLDPLETLTRRAVAHGANYFSVMRGNLGRLRLALGCA